MAYKINDACVGCGLCAENCPVEAIAPSDGIYVIDESKCVGCGLCAENCPVSAPVEA
ncbi:MAG: 4Fe-4S binding protein [Oscillospiraceae bacterium]|nr:4Fe-4S binding protein [Oscillospiraceae bacterium]